MRNKESTSTFGGMMEELESMSLDMMMIGAEYSGTTTGDCTVPSSSVNASARAGPIKQVFINNRSESLRHLRRSSLASLYTSTATKVTFKGESGDHRSDNGEGRRMSLPDAYPVFVTEVHSTFRREDLSKDDVQSYWYSKQELKLLSKRNKSWISSLSSHGSRSRMPRRHSFSTPDLPGSLKSSGSSRLGSMSESNRRKSNRKYESSRSLISDPTNQNATTIVDKEQEDIAFSMYEDTCRGLESLINPNHRSLVRDHKRCHKHVVLTEQNRQYEKCEISPKLLAKCAQDSSESACVRAYIQGQQDAAELYEAMNMSSEGKAIVSSPVA